MEQSRLALKGNPSDQEALYHLIQALRESHKDTKGELPGLVKRLAELRAEARNTEASSNRYKLYEPSAPSRSASLVSFQESSSLDDRVICIFRFSIGAGHKPPRPHGLGKTSLPTDLPLPPVCSGCAGVLPG